MTDNNANPQGGGKGPLFAVIAVVILAGAGALFALAPKGSAESKKEQELSQISPASADTEKSAAAQASPEAPQDAQEGPMIKLGNPVVGVVNGEDVMRADVLAFIGQLPEQVKQMPIQTLFPLALEQVINNRLITVKAGGANLSSDPEVEKLVTQAKDQIIRNVFVERQIEEQISQKKLLESYQQLLDGLEEVDEVKARHILVEDEAKARELIGKLDGGADFAELAKESSDGPSAANGGDLGWFAESEMVPEFAKVAFATKPGTYTKDPVQTQFGWHVILVEEKRKRPEPEFEAVKPQLEAQLRQKILADLVQGWQKDAKIEKFDINGEPVKEEKVKKTK